MAKKKLKELIKDILSSPDDSFQELKEANERRVQKDEKYQKGKPRGLPTYLNIETTRRCNLNCIMCPFHSSPEARQKWGVASGDMDFELFKIIADEVFPTLQTCALSVTGEFTLTTFLPEVFNILGRYGVKFDGFTNAVLLTTDISKMMMPHLEAFTISIDSPVPDTYERIRRGSRWSGVVANIKSLMTIREKSKIIPRPRIDLQAVLMKSTTETLPELVRFAKEQGFDLIKGVHLAVFTEDMVEESLLKNRELYNRKREEAIETAREVDIEILMPPPLQPTTLSLEQRGDPPKGCEFLWRRSFVNYDGMIYACCAPRPPLMGHITGASFKQIWRGAAYSMLRSQIMTDHPPSSCVNCWIKSSNIPEGMEEDLLFHLDNSFDS